jgi:hypothetical protein
MGIEMTTAMWFVFALVVLELSALGFLWILYLIHQHNAKRHESHEPPAGAPVSPPAA